MAHTLRSHRHLILATLLLAAMAPATTAQTPSPAFDKAFSPSTISPGGVSTLTFTIDNTDGTSTRGLAFVDNLPGTPSQMVIATPANASTSCLGGLLSAPAGGTTIQLFDGDIPGGTSCTVTVDVTASAAGTYANVSGNLFTDAGDTGDNATADLTLAAITDRPAFSKSFAPGAVFFGGSSTLTFLIDNAANGSAASNLTFTDNLPPGMVVASPANRSKTCTGGRITAVSGSGVVSYAPVFFGDASVAAGGSCTISVDVVGNAVGELDNVSGNLTSTGPSGGTPVSSGPATATLTVSATPISLIKSFTDDPVPAGGLVTLEFTITNLSRDFDAVNVEFTDALGDALAGLEAISLPADPCGDGSSLSGTGTLALTGGNLLAEESCTFTATLQVPAAAVTGTYLNTTSDVTGDVGGLPVVGNPATDRLFVQPIPVLTKEFLVPVVGAGDDVDLRFTIDNTSIVGGATDVAFVDDLTAFLPFPVTVTELTDPCGAGSSFDLISLGTGRQGLSLTGGSIAAAGGSCTFDVTLTLPVGLASGTYVNLTDEITATVESLSLIGSPATAAFDVVGAPALIKEFTDDPVAAGGTVTLEFTLIHDEQAPAEATAVTFTDDLTFLPGLTATGLPAADLCGTGNGSLSGTAGDTFLTVSGITLQPDESCTFSVSLSVPGSATAGSYTNTTSTVTATVAGMATTGNAASDDLQIAGLVLTKEFTDDPVLPGATVDLEFTIQNISPTEDATGIEFTDSLSAVLSGLASTSGTMNDVCGSGSQIGGTSFLTFTGGSLTAGTSCTFSLTLAVPAGAEVGLYNNVTSGLSADFGGTAVVFAPATDALTVSSDLLAIAKDFVDDPVAQGDPVTLRFTLTNLSTADNASGVTFTDDLDAALGGLVATGPAISACGGTASFSLGGSLITFTGGDLAAGEVCSFDVPLLVPDDAPLGTAAINVTSQVTGMVDGLTVTGDPATAELLVDFNAFTKAWSAGDVVPGSLVTLEFTLGNLDPNDQDVLLNFSDNLDAVIPGLEPTDLPKSGICGPESALVAVEVDIDGELNTVVLFTGGNLAPAGEPGATCTFSFEVQLPDTAAGGDFLNVTSDLLQGSARAARPASASITVQPAPAFSKSFSPGTILEGEISTLTLTIDNTGSIFAATDLDVTDALPAGMTIADPANATTDCSGGTLGAPAGGDTISYTGGTVAAGESCSVQVDVTASPAGTYMNVTGDLTSSSGNSGSASEKLIVDDNPDDDGDGVPDADDFCDGTEIPEGVPTVELRPNRYALVDDDFMFDTFAPPGGGSGPRAGFDTTGTGGCSCEQIIEALGLGQGHVRFGCSIGAMRNWVDFVAGGGSRPDEPMSSTADDSRSPRR